MGKEEKCILCNELVKIKYIPMDEWKINGVLCSKCYSKKICDYERLLTNFLILSISSSSCLIFLSTTRSIASFQT